MRWRRNKPSGAEPTPVPLSRFQRVVERLLLVAVVICVVLMTLGVVLAALAGEGLPRMVLPLAAIPAGLLGGDPAAYLSLGLLVLVAIPVVRVVGGLVGFALERDWRYVAVTTAVLVVMAVSLLLGQA